MPVKNVTHIKFKSINSSLNFAEFSKSNEHSPPTTPNISIFGTKSNKASSVITIQSESNFNKEKPPTFDFLLEFTIENEDNLRNEDDLLWDLKMLYPTVGSKDLEIRYDDSRDLEDLKLRARWKDNNSLERGQALRFIVQTYR